MAAENIRCADGVTRGKGGKKSLFGGHALRLEKCALIVSLFTYCLHVSNAFLISCLKHLIILLSCLSSNGSEHFQPGIYTGEGTSHPLFKTVALF